MLPGFPACRSPPGWRLHPPNLGGGPGGVAAVPARVVMEQRDLRNWPSLIERLGFLRPELVLLDITGLTLPVDEAVRAFAPPCPIACWSHSIPAAQPETILAAMRAGANEFLYPPLEDGLRKAVERPAGVRPRPRESGRPAGKVLGSCRPKGMRARPRLPATWRRRSDGSAFRRRNEACWPIWTWHREWWGF